MQERDSSEKDSNNNTPYAVGVNSMAYRLWDRERNKNNRGIKMKAYEAMKLSSVNAANVMTDFCMAIVSEMAEEKIPEELREALRAKIAMIASITLNSEVEEMKA